MSYKVYNDYELLYLVKEVKDHIALDILIKKYTKYIYKKAISFFPREKNLDDYYQEGIICLFKAINSFDDNYNKTFMRYFEVLLNRHFINIYHKNKREDEKLLLVINEAYVDKQYVTIEEEPKIEINVKLGSKTEEIVYYYYFKKGKKIGYLCEKLNFTRKQVYNAIYRVRRKIEEQIEKEQ